MKKYRHLRGTLFDIERELRTRNLGAGKAFSIAQDNLRRNTLVAAGEAAAPQKKSPTSEALKEAKMTYWISASEGYNEWKKKVHDDIKKRLKDLLGEKEEGRLGDKGVWSNMSWDFWHWMCDGEMPNSYGFGLNVRDYYFALSIDDQKEFDKACQDKKIRAATTITWLLDRFQPVKPEFIDKYPAVKYLNEIKNSIIKKRGEGEQYKKFESEWQSKAEKLVKEPNGLGELLEKLNVWYNKNEGNYFDANGEKKSGNTQEQEIYKKLSSDDDVKNLVVEFRNYGHALRKFIIGQLNNNNNNVPEHMKIFAESFKNKLKDFDEKYKLSFENSKYGHPVVQAFIRMTFGEIGRAWGDATAAKGLHPFTLEQILQSHSATVPDYGKIGKEERDKTTLPYNWCDMNAPGSLWSLGANLDRYRDTLVILHTPDGQTENLNRESGVTSNPKLAATFSEIQMSYERPFTITKNGMMLTLDAQSLQGTGDRTIGNAGDFLKLQRTLNELLSGCIRKS